ncbi:hypothetical protein M409DRAFT_23679 [Zasmidium cellare ATCC 36951]|uniref:MYND-type domain-containing protein n=1 Tax=Zasmidium cellare ATCC 36951 TaxID=1080233 RepID=A0A6A6CJR3_ZASCE|nr:uncharacterized protein M409DRAFT_23679 [Zasmidium cellare ATCC 36951]KAF2165949.1 hypothetical protein M409DRAFT_23679 [Zasmidium cellare ATCC 36951]
MTTNGSQTQTQDQTRYTLLKTHNLAFCTAFTHPETNPPSKLLSEHLTPHNPRITEYGPAWATSRLPFLGKTFAGHDGVLAYFDALDKTLEFLPREDTFGSVVVDERAGEGGVACVKGKAGCRAVETGKEWEEEFVVRLSEFDGEGKIGHVELWGDTLTVCHSKQQQREVLRTANGAQEEDWSDEESSFDDDNASTCAAVLTTDDTKSTKMGFLDRLAEILCSHKEASYVTCTSMIEDEGSVTLLAARNEEWTSEDAKLLNQTASIMEQIASQMPSENDLVLNLGILLSDYYDARLRYHVESFLELLMRYKVNINEKVVNNVVHEFRRFLAGKICASAMVDDVERTIKDSTFLEKICSRCSESASKKLMNELHCINRPRRAANAICRAARDIDAFQTVQIFLLPGYPPKKLGRNELSPYQPLSSTAMRYLSKCKWVHAEIRMVTYLLSHDEFRHAFAYLGISKKSCLLCGHIIQSLGRFNTRSNHGKIYSQWTVPSKMSLPNIDVASWERAVEGVRDVLRLEAERDELHYIQAVKESTITTPAAPRLHGGDIFTSHVDDPRLREREMTWLSSAHWPESDKSKAQDDCNPLVDDLEALPNVQEPEPGTKVTSPIAIGQELRGNTPCSSCQNVRNSMIKCSRCSSAPYCNTSCRQKHWMEHKFHCHLGRPIDEADHLVRACHRGQYPTDDEDVATAFGFRHFIQVPERLRLFDIYWKLVNYSGLGDEELREARETDQLKQFILFRGSQLSPGLIGDDLEWLRSKTGFAANSVCNFGNILDCARDVLGSRQLQELDSQLQKQAYLFYCQIRAGYRPDADEDNWLRLGFCTARTSKQMDRICRCYARLIESCTFEEFCLAVEKSTMVELFGKYGHSLENDDFRNFNTLMRTVGRWHQSVWELKRFTLLTEREPMRSVFVDYGFRNCHNPRDRLKLREMYSRYFARGLDEMELHQACIEGNLFPFLTSRLGDLSLRSELLSNPYPLDQCNHMGLVARKVAICTEADYDVVCEKFKADGDDSVVWTIPDSCGDDMAKTVRDRAANVTGQMRIGQSRVKDYTFRSMSSD